MSKKRIGFVSNSSSSSFVLIGIKIGRELSEYEYDKIEDSGLRYLSDDEVDSPLLGDITTIYDDDYSVSESPMIDLDNLLKEIQEFFPDTKKEDIKMFTGMRSC